jgi:transglutaminase/protease-like cytokinesis protein 3
MNPNFTFMNRHLKRIAGILFLALPLTALSQTGKTTDKSIDDYVRGLGNLDSLNMGTIALIVTKPYSDKRDKARAIFDWIAFNIRFDCKAARAGNGQKNTPTEVLLYRIATGTGYASLFQDMCSAVDIRCLIPDGFVKISPEQIGDYKTDINHCWAVVQLGQSPEEWYYVDPAWGSGYTDPEMKVFTPSFNDHYFFADKTVFNLQHYPDNEAWKLGKAPKTRKDFFSMPVIRQAAYDFGLTAVTPYSGHVKTSPDKPVAFSFKLENGSAISSVTLVKTANRKQKEEKINYSFKDGALTFNVKFEEGSSIYATVRVNGMDLATYLVDTE